MPRGKPSPKLAITIDRDVYEEIRKEASLEGTSVSAWITEACRKALKRTKGLAAIAEWEKEHGAFTEEEMAEARRRVDAELAQSRKVRRSA